MTASILRSSLLNTQSTVCVKLRDLAASMNDDTVEHYRGREAEWAALCAFDAVACGLKPSVTEGDADHLVSSAWDFIVESCREADAPIPDRSAVLQLVKPRIEARNVEPGQS